MDLMDHMNLMDYMNAVMQNSPFCPSGSNKYRFFENKKNPEKQLLLLLPDFFFFALFPTRVDGSWGRGKLLFTRKEDLYTSQIF